MFPVAAKFHRCIFDLALGIRPPTFGLRNDVDCLLPGELWRLRYLRLLNGYVKVRVHAHRHGALLILIYRYLLREFSAAMNLLVRDIGSLAEDIDVLVHVEPFKL